MPKWQTCSSEFKYWCSKAVLHMLQGSSLTVNSNANYFNASFSSLFFVTFLLCTTNELSWTLFSCLKMLYVLLSEIFWITAWGQNMNILKRLLQTFGSVTFEIVFWIVSFLKVGFLSVKCWYWFYKLFSYKMFYRYIPWRWMDVLINHY